MKILLSVFFIISLSFSSSLKNINLQLQWKHQFEFAGFYMAKEKGYYKDIGLNVNFIEYDGKSDIVDSVLNGNAEFGLSYSSLIAEFLSGKDILFLANYLKQSPLVLVTQKDIKTPKDLQGKKIMGVSNTIDGITLKLMLDKFNISDDNIINIPTNFKIDSFINKQVDAMAAFTTNEIYQLDKLEYSYNIFNPSLYGYEYYDLNLFTSKKYFLQNSELVDQFKIASNKGWEYALKNKEETIDLILKKFNSQNKTKEALFFEAKQIEQLMFTKTESIGSIDPLRIKFIAKSFLETGYVDSNYMDSLDEFIYDFLDYKEIVLSKEEKKYLAQKEEIRMCVDPNWEPYEIIDKGKNHVGFSADYIKLIEKKINKKIKLVVSKNWVESIEYIKSGKCEIVSFLNKTQKKQQYLNFTPILYSEPEVIIAKGKIAYFDGFESLNGKTVALVKTYRNIDFIEENYSNINIKYIQNYAEGIKLISSGEIDAMIDSLLRTSHFIKKYDIFGVKIAGKTELTNEYRIGVMKNDLLLHSILSKAVSSISEQEKDKILSNWISIKFDEVIDYKFILKVSIAILIILIILYYRQYTIKKLNKEMALKVEKQLEQIVEKDRMLFVQNKFVSMGEMIENIAHQWRQPLSQINSSILLIDDELYRNNIENPIIKEKLEEIETLSIYMSKTIDDFRNFYENDNEQKIFNISYCIEQAINIVSNGIKYDSIQIKCNLDDSIVYKGYINQLKQVILIMLNNAKDILVENKIDIPIIEIELKRQNRDIIINISDNGGGIVFEPKEKVFEPYVTSKNKSQGTGLGLFIAKKIILESFKGVIFVENNNNGAIFTILLKQNMEKFDE